MKTRDHHMMILAAKDLIECLALGLFWSSKNNCIDWNFYPKVILLMLPYGSDITYYNYQKLALVAIIIRFLGECVSLLSIK